MFISDQVTGGKMAMELLTPETFGYINFNSPIPITKDHIVTLTGLESYWHNAHQASDIMISISNPSNNKNIQLTIPFRKKRTILYATEMASWEILKYLKKVYS